MNVYYKIMKEYMKKRISVYVLMVITIIATFVLVFTPIIVVKSQCINTIAYLNKYKPKLQYQFVHFLSFLPKYQNLT